QDQAASDLSRAAAGGGHAAQGRGRRDRGDRGQAAAMAEPDQRPQPASGTGRIRQAAAGGVSAVQAFVGGLPEPGGGWRLGGDDRGSGGAGGLPLGAEQRPLPPAVAVGGHHARQGRAVPAAAGPSEVDGNGATRGGVVV